MYFDKAGERKAINQIHKALSDGTLRLVWQGTLFMIVSPTYVWLTDYPQNIDVNSNVNWTVE